MVALSSIKTEYRGIAIAVCEAMLLKRLLKDLDESVDEPVLVYCNNLNNIRLAKNPVFHPRAKHIEVYYHNI